MKRLGWVALPVVLGALAVHNEPDEAWILLAAAGACLRLWAAGTVEKRRALTTGGPYSLVRHPLYLGTLLALVGVALFFESLPLLVLSVVGFGASHLPKIRREERVLAGRFGRAWAEYARRVPMLIPRPRRPAGGGFSLARARVNHGFDALALVVLLYLSVELWEDFLLHHLPGGVTGVAEALSRVVCWGGL